MRKRSDKHGTLVPWNASTQVEIGDYRVVRIVGVARSTDGHLRARGVEARRASLKQSRIVMGRVAWIRAPYPASIPLARRRMCGQEKPPYLPKVPRLRFLRQWLGAHRSAPSCSSSGGGGAAYREAPQPGSRPRAAVSFYPRFANASQLTPAGQYRSASPDWEVVDVHPSATARSAVSSKTAR